ncbi:sulfurtransferase [Agaricicola taiwanensis]|uniref:3-mercaptopyruvate sulfurtransferase n=1 Tax=Agaricicola taiwanensis TaxID=591372 RepID=A0A8J2YKD2_9RHOB|nr:3-mercaptopyruvate sulfurtransferase [Agaricicola taiwanensis]GGE47799.1 sulfurtransferase [Agaricicola taiwanensis]
MHPLVTTEWLAQHLVGSDVIVFDATKYLPNEPVDGRQKFAEAHIPGARFFDIDEVADPDASLPHMVPTPARFEKLMTALGVTNDAHVVFYDQKGLASAARGWWLMRLFGHDKASVLDGGLPKWIREGRALEQGHVTPTASLGYRADFRAGMLRGIGDMLDNATSQKELVLDARPAGRFTGEVPEPRAGMRGGHIPGSTNIPASEILNADHTVRTPEALRALFSAAGVDGSRPVVTSCGSGVTAAMLTLGMVLAGLPEGALYDGSWSEWGSRPDTPIDKG